LGKISQAAGNYEGGDTARLIEYDGDKIGVLICYESVFPELARAHVKAGADWLVVMTNDAWFGRSSASYQHFSQAVARAVETRRSVIRAANTGISGFILPNGRVQADFGLFKQGVVMGRLVRPQIDTIYTAVGDIIPKVSLGITICLFLAALIGRKRNAGRPETTI
jgi:apolipoprotein N-acyltransferase